MGRLVPLSSIETSYSGPVKRNGLPRGWRRSGAGDIYRKRNLCVVLWTIALLFVFLMLVPWKANAALVQLTGFSDLDPTADVITFDGYYEIMGSSPFVGNEFSPDVTFGPSGGENGGLHPNFWDRTDERFLSGGTLDNNWMPDPITTAVFNTTVHQVGMGWWTGHTSMMALSAYDALDNLLGTVIVAGEIDDTASPIRHGFIGVESSDPISRISLDAVSGTSRVIVDNFSYSDSVVVTPIPPSLFLFLTALGALSGIGWWKRRPRG